MNIRFVSNGYGEDYIACKLASRLLETQSSVCIDAVPLVGEGNQYVSLGITPQITQRMLPSGGFLFRFKDIVLDILAGGLRALFKQYRVLRQGHYDYQVVVGDIFALLMATRGHSIPTYFLPTAKTERAIPHLWLEFWLMRRYAIKVFPRDIETHRVLLSHSISSIFYGNPMFDDMCSDLPKPSVFTMGILPGSRLEAIGNMAKILQILPHIKVNFDIQYKVSLSPSFTFEHIERVCADIDWRFCKSSMKWVYNKMGLEVYVSYQFFDVIQESSVVLGLAGTANEQAMFVSRPVISFIGTGPQSSKKRFLQQQQLIDGAASFFIDSTDSVYIANSVTEYLHKHLFNWTPLLQYQQQVALEIALHLTK